MGIPSGTRLGPYEVQSALGAGGMGEVYRARDTRLDRTVAIKVLPSHVASDPDLRARFEREARAIAALDHPHICALYDVGEQDGVHYLVMQYLEGETLAARLGRSKAVPTQEMLKIATEIADALDKAHRAGITHRDLKPANVMLTKGGAKLLDFGLAKLRGPAAPISMSGMTRLGAPSPTERGTILGTVHYMAPEQVEGKEADARSDIFALGALMYEMATGKRPFEGDSPASVIGSILKDDPPPLSAVQPLLPPALDHVVSTSLAKDPDERWQSAADVRRELTWIASSLSTPALAAAGRRPSNWTALGWWIATAALLIALAVTLPAALRHWSATPAESPVVRFAVYPPENTTFAASGASVPGAQLAVSPDGRRLVFVAAPPGGRQALWIRAFDTIQSQMLAGTEDASYPFWSPDSRFIGFFAANKLKKIEATGGAPQALCDASSDSRGATWNQDGVIVFSMNTAAGLYRITAAGGVPSPLTKLRDGEVSHRWPSFLPDGRHFLFYARGAANQRGVYVESLDGQMSPRLLEGNFAALYSPSGHLLTVREGTLLAYAFDDKQMHVAADPVRVAEGVGGTSINMADFSLSAGGVLAFSPSLTTLSRLEWFDRTGKALGAATDVGDYVNFRLSPDDRRVAITRVDPQTSTLDIWLMEVSRPKVLTRFTTDPSDDTAPIWSPDGQRIRFRSARTGVFLYEKPTGGGEERQVGSFDASFPTDWSPDGKFVAFHGNNLGGVSWDIAVVAVASDAKPVPFSQSTFTQIDGHFSPDGRWLAYASDESGHLEVYVQPFPRSGGKWQVSTNGGSEPHWRRDGKELFYLAPDRTIMAVTVHAAATFESDAPRPLFQTRAPSPGSVYRMNYDVTGDGSRFLVNTLVEGAGSSPINVVLNWTAALKR